MHRVLTILGVALVVLGLVFSFVPLLDGPSQVLTPSQPTAAFNATTPISLTSDWTIGMSWTSNQKVSLLVVVCRAINQTASSLQTVCPGASLTVLNGTSGSGTFSVPIGGTLLVGIVSAPSQGLHVDVQLKPTLASIGAILVIGGAGVTVVGLLPRRKPRPPAPTASSAPEGGVL
ncbi:MAG: hypothetical protein WCB19_03715 [Thermoplasmata archaeon]